MAEEEASLEYSSTSYIPSSDNEEISHLLVKRDVGPSAMIAPSSPVVENPQVAAPPVSSPAHSLICEHAPLDDNSDDFQGVNSSMTLAAFLADFKSTTFQPEPLQQESSQPVSSQQESIPIQSSSSEHDNSNDENYDVGKDATNESVHPDDNFDEESSSPAPAANVRANVPRNITASASASNTTAAENVAKNFSVSDSSYEISVAFSPLFYIKDASVQFKSLLNRNFVEEQKREIDVFTLHKLNQFF